MTTASKWLKRFETVCAMYRCRPIETIARNVRNRATSTSTGANDNLFISGPSGFWLNEITSVEFDAYGALMPTCYNALLHLAQFAVLNYIPVRILAIDWFMTHITPRHGERRQCLVRIDANNHAVFVTLLANNVRNANLSPAGLAYSRYVDRLRPFTIILMCEILERDVSIQVLNIHGEPFISSTRWLHRRHLKRQRDEAESAPDYSDPNGDLALINHPAWLELIRDAHTQGRWIRVLGYTNVNVNSIVSERALSGSMRYMWRDRRPMRAGSRVSECPIGWLLPLLTLEDEISSIRPTLLPLCDFAVLMRRTNILLLNLSTHSTQYRNLCWTRTIPIRRDEVEPNEKLSQSNAMVQTNVGSENYSSSAIETLREKRYFVRADGQLASAKFISLS